ncbi:MAG: nitroreductase family protein [bacterium]
MKSQDSKDLKEIIYGRSSVRKFSDKPVPEELLYEVIDAGRMSPSPTNSQPWYFSIFSKEDKHGISEILYEEAQRLEVPGTRDIVFEAAKITASAPLVITAWNMKHFSNRLRKIEGLIGDDFRRNYERAELVSIGCAVQNMWLMAHALGLGMVWLMATLRTSEECSKKFGLQGELVAYLPIGYPLDSNTAVKKRRKSLSDICSFYSSREEEIHAHG